MDLDHARAQLLRAPNAPPFTQIALELLTLVGQLDQDLAVERQRRQDLERSVKVLRERLAFAADPT